MKELVEDGRKIENIDGVIKWKGLDGLMSVL